MLAAKPSCASRWVSASGSWKIFTIRYSPSIVQLARHDSSVGVGARVVARGRRRIQRGVDHVGCARLPHRAPHFSSRIASKRSPRHVRQPEAHEYEVVASTRGVHSNRSATTYSTLSRRTRSRLYRLHFGRRIDRRHSLDFRGARQRVNKPVPHASSSTTRGRATSTNAYERTLDLRDVGEPRGVERVAAIVAPRAKPPLVVFAGPRAVIRDLLGEQCRVGVGRFAHDRMISRPVGVADAKPRIESRRAMLDARR